jgi:TctA family transporter
MLVSSGDPTVFVTRPIPATPVGLSLPVLVLLAMPSVKKVRTGTVQEAA